MSHDNEIKIPSKYINIVVDKRFPEIEQEKRLQLYKLILGKCKHKLTQECDVQKQIIQEEGFTESNGINPQCYYFVEDNIKVCGFYATYGALKGQGYLYSREHSSDDGGLCFRLIDIRSLEPCRKTSCSFIGVVKKK